MSATLRTRVIARHVSRLTASTPSCASRRFQSTAAAAASLPQHVTTPKKLPVDPFKLVEPELAHVRKTLTALVGSSHPALTEIASYYLLLPGKQLRPLIVLLFAHATNGLGSGYEGRRSLPLNIASGSMRSQLDASLSKSSILNDWNPRIPDHTSSFAEPFTIRPFPTPPPEPSPLISTEASQSPLPQPPLSSPILPTQLRLAQITEMIHVASLLHDDVIDRAETRRAAPSAPFAFGNKFSVLGGDFLLGRASTALCRLGDIEVVELISTVISNLVEGEVLQLRKTNSLGSDGGDRQDQEVWMAYLKKSYLKTASLIAKSARASVVLGGAEDGSEADELLKDIAYAYGRNIGIAFQLIDDALDFSPSSDLGKPGNGADLKLGLATAPTLYAWEEYPEMGPLVARRFKHEGDVEMARDLVLRSSALQKTKELAGLYSAKALEALEKLPPSDAREALAGLANTVVNRAR